MNDLPKDKSRLNCSQCNRGCPGGPVASCYKSYNKGAEGPSKGYLARHAND